MTKSVVYFDVQIENAAAHLFKIQCRLDNPNPDGQLFRLPTWIPGSYLQREFAKNILSVKANVPIQKIDKNTWKCEAGDQSITLEYLVYAWDHSIRHAFLDENQLFFNGTSLFLRPVGLEHARYHVNLNVPHPQPLSTKWRGESVNYDDLVDKPIYIGSSENFQFEAGGIPHELVVIGKHDGDLTRLVTDLTQLCTTHIAFFKNRAPFKQYQFLLRVEEDGYGGLEHQSSCAVLCKRSDLPRVHDKEISEGYRSLLGLLSHEYFHAWNVKAMRPHNFVNYDYDQENYTDMLWFFEGFTSYYDDLMLLKSNLISQESYLDLLGKTVTRVWQSKGRFVQTLKEASFDTWIKFYRPDENSPNSTISYYTKGALVALALDIQIRVGTKHKRSLDDVMNLLFDRYQGQPVGLTEKIIMEAAEKIAGISLKSFFTQALDSTEDFDFVTLLSQIGINSKLRAAPTSNYLGLKLNKNGTTISFIESASAAERCGLASGDTLVAINGFEVTSSNFDAMLKQHAVGETVTIHAFRRGCLFETKATLAEKALDMWELA